MNKERMEHLKNRFEKQMKKQRYDNSGRKHEFIAIAEELLSTVEEQQKENERLKNFYNYFSELYGINLEVSNWHGNGELKPFDDFFDDAESEMDDNGEKARRVLAGDEE